MQTGRLDSGSGLFLRVPGVFGEQAVRAPIPSILVMCRFQVSALAHVFQMERPYP